MKIVTKESAIQAYKVAPQVIKNAVDSGRTVSVIVEIGKKHNLHIDVFGKLAQLNSYLLLGLINPEEVLNELIALGIPDKDAREIMTEINQKIFVPLREEMRKGPNAEVKPPQVQSVAPSSAPRESVLQSRTTIIPANPNLPQRPAQTLASVPRYVPPKKYFNLQNKIPPPVPTPPIQPVQPQRRDVIPAQAETKLLEDHEEPHIEFSKTPMPAKTAPPPLNLPGVIQPPVIPDAQPSPVIPKVEPQPKPVVPIAPYSADPYREPIEP